MNSEKTLAIFLIIQTIFYIFIKRIDIKRKQLIDSINIESEDSQNNIIPFASQEKALTNFLSIGETFLNSFNTLLIPVKDISSFLMTNILLICFENKLKIGVSVYFR